MDDGSSEWNALDMRTRALIRAILYPVMFTFDPDDNAIAHVSEMVIDRRALSASPDEYRAAIQKVLAGRCLFLPLVAVVLLGSP